MQKPGRRAVGGPYVPSDGRPDQLVVVADVGAVRGLLEIEVAAEGKCRPGRGTLPGRAERRRPSVPAIERPLLIRALEPTVAETPEQDGLTAAQHGQIADRVAIDVERVRAGHVGQVGRGIVDRREPEAPADLAFVAREERGARRRRRGTGPGGDRRRNRTRQRHRRRTTGLLRRTCGRSRPQMPPRRSAAPRLHCPDAPPPRTADPAIAMPAAATTTTNAMATRRPTERFMRSPTRSVASSSCAMPPGRRGC